MELVRINLGIVVQSSFNFSDRLALAKAIFGANYGILTSDIKDKCFISFYHKVLKAIEFRNTLTSAVENSILDKNKCQQVAQEAMLRREDFLSTKSAPYPVAFKRALLEQIIREIYYNDDILKQLDISGSTIKYYRLILDATLSEQEDKRAIYGILDFAKNVFNNPYKAPSFKDNNFFNKNIKAEEHRLKLNLEVRLAQVFGEVNHNSNMGTNFRNKFDAMHKVFQADDELVFDPNYTL